MNMEIETTIETSVLIKKTSCNNRHKQTNKTHEYFEVSDMYEMR